MEWNYFRLECSTLKPSGVYESVLFEHEELLEIEPLVYVDRSYADEGTYDEEPLPPTSRIVDRHLKGDFVIFQKTSKYNQITDTYDGRHNKMNTDGFREYIKEKVEALRDALGDPKILSAVSKADVDIDDFLLDVLRDDFHNETLTRFRDDHTELESAN